MGLDLLFADAPKNLRVPRILTSRKDVPLWNMCHASYFEVIFAIANTNLHNDDVYIFAHTVYPNISMHIHSWAHMEDYYVAEDRFGMSDLDL